MRFLLRIILIFIVISAVLSVIRGLFASTQPVRRNNAPAPGKRDLGARNRLIKDPVCGTYVDEGTALEADGQFFCSTECRSKYLAS